MDLKVKVGVRCRPLSEKEIARDCKNIVSVTTSSSINIVSEKDRKDFTFDHCYGSDSTQESVYIDLAKPLLFQAVDGFNGCIFACKH
jgi:hypothetical protein